MPSTGVAPMRRKARSRSPDQRDRLLDLLDPEEVALDGFIELIGLGRGVQPSMTELKQPEPGRRLNLTE